jgi:flagellar motor protein MotB
LQLALEDLQKGKDLIGRDNRRARTVIVLARTEAQLSATLTRQADQIAGALQGKEQRMTVYGYTDNVGADDMNLELSQRQAAAVRDYLVA